MNLSYPDLKLVLYTFLVAMGLAFLWAAFHFFMLFPVDPDPIGCLSAALAFLLTGSLCLIFGLDTWILHDDPDVWR